MTVRIRKRSPYAEFFSTLLQLLIRQIKVKVGSSGVGIIWILVEPIFGVVILGLVLKPFLGRGVDSEIPYVFFLLCGFILLKTFMGSLTAGIGALSSGKNLLIFRQIQPFDLFIVKFLYNFLETMVSFLLFISISAWFGVNVSYGQLHILFACFIITWLYGSGLGLFVGSLVHKYEFLKIMVAIISRPIFFVSCIMFSLNAMPLAVRKYLLMNPIVHTVEELRMSIFPNDYFVAEVNLFYPFICSLVTVCMGLVAYRNNRKFLL